MRHLLGALGWSRGWRDAGQVGLQLQREGKGGEGLGEGRGGEGPWWREGQEGGDGLPGTSGLKTRRKKIKQK